MKASNIPAAARLQALLVERTNERDRFVVDRFGEMVFVRVDNDTAVRIDDGSHVERLVTAMWDAVEADCEKLRDHLRELGVTEFGP